MKTANIASARVLEPRAETHADSAQARMDRMEALLRRHPQIGDEETEELIRFLTKGSQMEIGTVSGRDGLAPRLAAFRRLHAARFRPSVAAQLLFAVAVVGPILLLAWYLAG
ncbi:MAG: hypothetical protein KF780_05215 [Sphingomonas sp.]|nr:hypothetical protein [Sphingomonas sp.]